MAGRGMMWALSLLLVAVVSVYAQNCPNIKISGPQVLTPDDGRDPADSKVAFGKYFRIDGDTMVVGAYRANNFRGECHIFTQKPDKSWEFVQTIKDPEAKSGAYFSLYLGVSNGVTAVSSPFYKTHGYGKAGRVSVFVKTGGTWVWDQTLEPDVSISHQGMSYGYGLGSSGNTIVVGARKMNDNSTGTLLKNRGAIFIYSRPNASSKFGLDQIIYGPEAGAQYGDDISVDVGGYPYSGSIPKILVGAPRAGGSQKGAGFLYRRKGNGVWVPAQTPKMVPQYDFKKSATYIPHHFEGHCYWKDRIISGGERAANPSKGNGGAAWTWKYNPASKKWIQGPGIFPGSTGRRFGQRLDVYNVPGKGLVSFVGSWGERVGGETKAGAAYAYVECSDGSWSMIQKLVLPNPGFNDQFGNMIAMADGVVAIGAPKKNSGNHSSNPTDRGAVYVYNFK